MRFLLFLFSTFYYISVLNADALMVNKAMFNPSIAKYYVSQTGVKIELELTQESLESFADIYPNSIRKLMGLQQTPLKKRSQEFLKNELYIKADGKALVGTVVAMHGGKKLIRDKTTGEVLKVQPKNRPATLYISIEYPFISLKPKTLQLIHNTPATLGFIVYHEKQPVNDFSYLYAKQSLRLDWVDPFYSAFTTKTLHRVYKYPAMGYLYIEPRLIRLESLIRLKDIYNLSYFKSQAKKSPLVKEDIEQYFSQDKNIAIDDKYRSADKVSINYFRRSISGLQLVQNIKEVDTDSLFVGISQQFYVDKLPQSVESKWLYFNKKMQEVPFNIIDPLGPYPGIIYKNDPAFKWDNLIKDKTEPKIIAVKTKTGVNWNLPMLGDTKVWKKLPTKQQSKEIIEKTLENIRIAFIEKREKRLSGELSKIVLSTGRSAIKKELSKLFAPSVVRGGVGSIEEFSSLDIDNIREVKDRDGFSASVRGNVNVVAQHWGHSDRVGLKYQMIIDLIEKDGEWFIKEFTLLDLKEEKL
jgi:hypothetical protein